MIISKIPKVLEEHNLTIEELSKILDLHIKTVEKIVYMRDVTEFYFVFLNKVFNYLIEEYDLTYSDLVIIKNSKGRVL